MPCRCCDQGCFATPLPSSLSNSDAGVVRETTPATPYPCYTQLLRRGADPLLYASFAVLYQASALQSFAMPTPHDSMPLLLYAFPWPCFTDPVPCYSEPCLCGTGERAALRALLKSAALCLCFATPRLAVALLSKSTALGFHALALP